MNSNSLLQTDSRLHVEPRQTPTCQFSCSHPESNLPGINVSSLQYFLTDRKRAFCHSAASQTTTNSKSKQLPVSSSSSSQWAQSRCLHWTPLRRDERTEEANVSADWKHLKARWALCTLAMKSTHVIWTTWKIWLETNL